MIDSLVFKERVQMTVFCLGSINADHVYQVQSIPNPGETIASNSLATGLGGKGANQSVAAAKAGSITKHIGSVGMDGRWAIDELTAYGVETDFISTSEQATGHAIINVDTKGENAIVVHAGANADIKTDAIKAALNRAKPCDYLLIQNETNGQVEAAKIAKQLGVTVVYSAAPFDTDAVKNIIAEVDVLCVNEFEAAQLEETFQKPLKSLGLDTVLITKGSKGAELFHQGKTLVQSSFPVTPLDTTGAGDTFAGFFVAALEQGNDPATALKLAAAAAAIQVTRPGAATAIPDRAEVDRFIAANA